MEMYAQARRLPRGSVVLILLLLHLALHLAFSYFKSNRINISLQFLLLSIVTKKKKRRENKVFVGRGPKRIKRIFDTFKCALIVYATPCRCPPLALLALAVSFVCGTICCLASWIFVIFLSNDFLFFFASSFFIVCFCVLAFAACQCQSHSHSYSLSLFHSASCLGKSNLLSFCQLRLGSSCVWSCASALCRLFVPVNLVVLAAFKSHKRLPLLSFYCFLYPASQLPSSHPDCFKFLPFSAATALLIVLLSEINDLAVQ